MSAVRAPRWALSFADLCLLLLGFFVILHARDDHREALAGGLRAAFGGAVSPAEIHGDYRAADIFEPGEAVLLPGRANALAAIGRRAAGAGGHVAVESRGADRGARRFDQWELAAARTAAVARAIRAGGIDDGRITIDIPAMREGGGAIGQTIAVTLRRARR